jgi:hypothetical protein
VQIRQRSRLLSGLLGGLFEGGDPMGRGNYCPHRNISWVGAWSFLKVDSLVLCVKVFLHAWWSMDFVLNNDTFC